MPHQCCRLRRCGALQGTGEHPLYAINSCADTERRSPDELTRDSEGAKGNMPGAFADDIRIFPCSLRLQKMHTRALICAGSSMRRQSDGPKLYRERQRV